MRITRVHNDRDVQDMQRVPRVRLLFHHMSKAITVKHATPATDTARRLARRAAKRICSLAALTSGLSDLRHP